MGILDNIYYFGNNFNMNYIVRNENVIDLILGLNVCTLTWFDDENGVRDLSLSMFSDAFNCLQHYADFFSAFTKFCNDNAKWFHFDRNFNGGKWALLESPSQEDTLKWLIEYGFTDLRD